MAGALAEPRVLLEVVPERYYTLHSSEVPSWIR